MFFQLLVTLLILLFQFTKSQLTSLKTLQEATGQAGDIFGSHISSNGQFLAVKVGNGDENGGINNGEIFIYGKDQGGTNNWGLVKEITDFATPNTGSLVAGMFEMSGNYLAVGDPEYDTPASGAGAIYIFKKDQGGVDNWGLLKQVQPTSYTLVTNDKFGRTWGSLYGDTLVGCTSSTVSYTSRCFVFYKDQGGVDNWGEIAELDFSTIPTIGILFDGWVRNDYYLTSSRTAKPASSPTDYWGAMYLFRKDNGGVDNWGLEIEIGGTHLNAQVANFLEGGDLGFQRHDMSIDNSRIAACVKNDDTGGPNRGKAVVLTNSGGQWLIEKILYSPIPTDNEQYCKEIRFSTDGNLLFITNPDEDNGGSNQGTVYVYSKDEGGTNNWGLLQQLEETVTETRFGKSIWPVNNYLFVGDEYDNPLSNIGRVSIFYTPSCLSDITCESLFYCNLNEECQQQVCTDSSDCYGLIVNNQLPYCNANAGYCENIFEETCTTLQDCNYKINLALASRDSLGKITQTASYGSNLTSTKSAISDIISTTKSNTTVTQTIYAFVDGSEQVTLNPLLFDTVNNNSLVLEQIENLICGSASQFCTAQITNRRLLQRDLQNTITVTVTYSVDSDIFDIIGSSGSFDSPTFIQNLADAVGVLPGNVTIVLIDGTFSIDYVIAEESDGQDPIDQSVLDSIDTVASEIDSITDVIVAQFNLQRSDFSNTSVDKCADRDCNGRGSCNSSTGICTCTNTDYWGVNCETIVTCANDGIKKTSEAYCKCTFPYYGVRCENTQNCNCQTI